MQGWKDAKKEKTREAWFKTKKKKSLKLKMLQI